MDPGLKFSLVKPDQWQALESSVDWLWTIVIVGGVVVGLVLLAVVVAQVVLFKRVADLETACKSNASSIGANASAIERLETSLRTVASDVATAGQSLAQHVEALALERMEWQKERQADQMQWQATTANLSAMHDRLVDVTGDLKKEVTAANIAVARLRQRVGHVAS